MYDIQYKGCKLRKVCRVCKVCKACKVNPFVEKERNKKLSVKSTAHTPLHPVGFMLPT